MGGGGAGFFGGNLGVRVGHGEDDGLVGHAADHVLGEGAFDGEAEEDVSTFDGVHEGAGFGFDGVGGFPLVHALGAALVDHAFGVGEGDVHGVHAHGLEELDAGDGGGAGAVDDEFGGFQVAAGEVAGVDEAGGGDDGGSVLVVVEDGDVHEFAQALLDDEALGGLDVLQVDAAEAGAEVADGVDELVDVFGVNAEVYAVDVGEAFEEGDLAFHDGLGAESAEVAEAEDGGAVGDDGDHVALGGVIVDEGGVAGDVQAGLGDAGGVGEGEVAGGGERFGEAGGELAGGVGGVHGEGFLAGDAGGAGVAGAVGHVGSPDYGDLGASWTWGRVGARAIG